jgi:anthranilate phosphoribosyltransferase
MLTPQTVTSTPEQARMRSFIQRVATGPEMSKDLSREEAREGMRLILEGQVDPVQVGIFLIALRMKRETDEENLGILDAILDATASSTAEADDVVVITDPFNGYNRILPASPFLPPVLAACGVATVSQGLEAVGPKLGITHRRVLRAAGAQVDLEPDQALAHRRDRGWAYVDQRRYSPALHNRVDLRHMMLNRSAITTAEVIPPCIRGARATHLVTGYVHKPYPRIYANLARTAAYDSCLLVRGVEGGVIPSLRQKSTMYRYQGDSGELPWDTDPATIGIDRNVRAVALPEELGGGDDGAGFDPLAAAEQAARLGLEALAGQGGATRDALVYGAALVLKHLGRAPDLAGAADKARAAIDSGEALQRLRVSGGP